MKILETVLYVDDLEVAKDFYTRILGFKFYSQEGNRHVFLAGDDAMLLLFNPEVTANEVDGMVPSHGGFGPGHVAFQMGADEGPKYEKLLADHGIEIEKKVNFGGGESIYFRDPAGNSLEFAPRQIWGTALQNEHV